MSYFSSDLQQESILSEYMDTVYEKNGKIHERVNDMDLQHRGIDVIFRNNVNGFKIDEKAQLHYLNQKLPTFALEISYVKQGVIKRGWLFDTDKQTEYYCFIFSILLYGSKEVITKCSDIKSVEAVLVNRLKLLIHLGNLGLSEGNCWTFANELRGNTKDNRKDFLPGFYFTISRHLAEQPVNLVVRKNFLAELGVVLK